MLFQVKRSFYVIYNMRVRCNISYIIHIIFNIYKDVSVARTYAYIYIYIYVNANYNNWLIYILFQTEELGDRLLLLIHGNFIKKLSEGLYILIHDRDNFQ